MNSSVGSTEVVLASASKPQFLLFKDRRRHWRLFSTLMVDDSQQVIDLKQQVVAFAPGIEWNRGAHSMVVAKDYSRLHPLSHLQFMTWYAGEPQGLSVCALISKLNGNVKTVEALSLQRLIWVTDENLRLTCISGACSDLGFSGDTLVANGQLNFLTEESYDFVRAIGFSMFQEQGKNVTPIEVKHSLRTVSGHQVIADIYLSLLYSEDGHLSGMLGIADFDITQASPCFDDGLFVAAVNSISEGVFVTDPNGAILRANSALYSLTGFKPQQILGSHCNILWRAFYGPDLFQTVCDSLVEQGEYQKDIYYSSVNGLPRPGLLRFRAVVSRGHTADHYVGILCDKSEKKYTDLKIHRLSHYDPLTGVSNRGVFNESLNQAVHKANQQGLGLAVLFLDLDRFKPINDSLGHNAGDQLLIAVSRRLMQCLNEHDVVSRMGGDEFAILLPALDPEHLEQSAIKMASRILAQFVAPFYLSEHEVYTSTSIGISLHPLHGESGEILLRSADTAMFAAKQAGKNNFKFYDNGMNKRAMDHLIMENAMRKALINERFELYFQPQYALGNGAMKGVEVLLRWNHPEFGSIKPVEFIDLAEQTDLIIPLGDWVFQQTCEKVAHWNSKGVRISRVGVNVSVHQFKRHDFAQWLLFQIDRFNLHPSQLELEITESSLMENVEHSIKTLTQLQQAQVRIAVDDFGTGYSSLNYLQKFPLNTLKIDRVFIEGMVENKATYELTKGVIMIAKSLQLDVIAEGVETWEQYKLLKESQCDEVQGYYLSQALSEKDLLELVTCKIE